MKRFFSLFLSFVLLLSIAGCASAPSVETGTTVESSAVSPTEAPTPSPEPTATPEPAPTPLEFTFDRYKLPADLSEYLAETGLTAEWQRLVDVVYAGSGTLSGLDRGPAADLAAVFAASPYAALAELSYADGQLVIAHTDLGTPGELEAAVTVIVEKVLFEESNELETQLSLYRTVSADFEFVDSESNSLYRMLVEKKGGAKEFAAALQYLFAQADIPAYLAEGTAGKIPHTWVIAEYNGALYHFDPVFENSVTGGSGLSCFGMSDTAHLDTGCSAAYTTGFDTGAVKTDDLCPDPLLGGIFTDVTDWQADTLAHTVSLSYGFAPGFSTTLDTTDTDAVPTDIDSTDTD